MMNSEIIHIFRDQDYSNGVKSSTVKAPAATPILSTGAIRLALNDSLPTPDSGYSSESASPFFPVTLPLASSLSSIDLADEPYYNPRLDPKNYMDGPLSHNPATRLRQMLARPGIVVRSLYVEPTHRCTDSLFVGRSWHLRWHQCPLCTGSRIRLSVSEVRAPYCLR